MSDMLYFIIHPSSNADTITVCDLSANLSYIKDDWHIAVNKDFYTAEKACKYARAIAKKYDLKYEPFESRYGDTYIDADPTEGLHLTLDEERNL